MMKTMVDLKPQELVVREALQAVIVKWVRFAIPLVALILVSSGAFVFSAFRSDAAMETLRENVVIMRVWGEEIAPLASRLRRATRERGSYQTLLIEPSWNELLGDIAGAAGGEVQISEIAMSRQRLQEGSSEETAVLRIMGIAPSNAGVSQFMQKLGPSEYLRGLALEVSRAARSGVGRTGVEFEVVCYAQ